MKRYFIWLIAALTVATYSAAESPQWNRVLAIQPKITATPSATAKARVLLAYTSAQGAVYRIAETDSVLELGGVNTTAPDGARRLNVRNTVSRTYTPVEGDLDLDADSKLWIYTGGQWVENGSASPAPIPMSGLSDWPATVGPVEVATLAGATGPLQPQIDALAASNIGRVSPPEYGDSPCSLGQWSTSADETTYYVCTGTNSWGTMAITALTTTAPASEPVKYTSQDTMISGVGISDSLRWAAGSIIATGTGTHNVKKLRVYVRTITGDPSTKHYKARFYSVTGSNLNQQLAESPDIVTGVSGAGWLEFNFPTPPSAEGNAWVVFATEPQDGSNFISIGYATGNPDAYSTYTTWQSNGTGTQNTDRDLRYELYE